MSRVRSFPLDLDVKHLAPPEKVIAGATAFVVWVKDANSETDPHNLGALKVDENLHGSMKAVTSLRSFDLYVTAEPQRHHGSALGRAVAQD